MIEKEIEDTLINTFAFLEGSDIRLLLEISTYKKCVNKEVIINSGKGSNDMFFILKGMIRGYYTNKDGEEINIFLRPEHTLTCSPQTLLHAAPSKYTFETVLETHVLIFPYNKLDAVKEKNKNIARLFEYGLIENIQTLIYRVESFVALTPEERYNDLFKKSPKLFKSAFNKHIANYLGITPVSLSRISKRKKN